MLNLVCKTNRELFARLYPTTMVFKDGSTITIKFHEPRQIIKMPVTLDECTTQAEKTAWHIRRRVYQDEYKDSDKDDVKFDAQKYIKKRMK